MQELQQALIEAILKIKKGDLNAFDLIYDLTKKQVFLAGKLIIKDEDLLQDLMQDTYIDFLKHIDKINFDQSILAYLCTSMRNKAINQYKIKKREINVDQYENEDIYGYTLEDKSNSDLLPRVKKLLSDKEYEIVILHALNDLTFKEIAQIVHKPLGTVLWTYNQAIKKLQKGLEKEYEI